MTVYDSTGIRGADWVVIASTGISLDTKGNFRKDLNP